MGDRRGSVLEEAVDVINGERRDVYGLPEDSFELIAKYWNIYTIEMQKRILVNHGFSLNDYELVDFFDKEDVAMMMALFKIARESHQHKRDNIRDAAGYLGIYADMQSNDTPVAESMTFEWKKCDDGTGSIYRGK